MKGENTHATVTVHEIISNGYCQCRTNVDKSSVLIFSNDFPTQKLLTVNTTITNSEKILIEQLIKETLGIVQTNYYEVHGDLA